MRYRYKHPIDTIMSVKNNKFCELKFGLLLYIYYYGYLLIFITNIPSFYLSSKEYVNFWFLKNLLFFNVIL